MSELIRNNICKNDPDKFCYACGQYIFVVPNKFTASLKAAFRSYFKVAPESLGESWTPNVLCNTCKASLATWMSGAK